jgi:hypothetical protein
VEGKFPEEKKKMLDLIDHYLLLPNKEKENFRLGRRLGIYQSTKDLSRPEVRNQVESVLRQIESKRPGEFEEVLSELTESFI